MTKTVEVELQFKKTTKIWAGLSPAEALSNKKFETLL